MKRQLDQMTLLLEKNNINLPEGARKRENQHRNIHPKRGHALMENFSKPRSLLIEYGALKHMLARKESFSSPKSDNNIPIHMGDDSQITSKGKGTVKLVHRSFNNVLYVPSLASNLLHMYQMTHTGFPKRVTFIPNDVEIS